MHSSELLLELQLLEFDRLPWLSMFDDKDLNSLRISWSAEIDARGNAVYHDHDEDAYKGNIQEIKFNYLEDREPMRITAHMSHIMSQLPEQLGVDARSFQLTRYLPGTIFPPHVDPYREAAIMVPLEPRDPAPITFHDASGKPLVSHVYRVPTLVNTSVLHSVANDSRIRSILQITLQQTFATSSKLLAHLSKA